MLQKAHPFQTWHDFTKALEEEFGPSNYECPRVAFFKLAQTGTLSEYYLELTSLANRVDGLSREELMDCFEWASRRDIPRIRRDVKFLSLMNIGNGAALAKLFKERFTPTNKPKSTPTQPKYRSPYHKYPTINPKHHLSLNVMCGINGHGILGKA